MKAWQIQSFGIDKLFLSDMPQPRPGPEEVLLRMHAVSLNYRDLLMVEGVYNPKLALPRIPCSDGAGEVVAIGEGVTAVAVGQRVAAIFMQNWIDGQPTAQRTRGALGGDIDGVLAEYVVLPQDGLVPLPDHLSYSEGSTLPCAGVTAWNALHHAAHITAGDIVVIQGTGGVSIFALQFAKVMGATVFGTSSSNEKLQRAKTLGLDAGTNYLESPDWAKWVLQQTSQRGADLIVEVGGAGTLSQSLQAVRMGGAIAQIGVLSQSDQPLPIALVLHRQARIQGIYVGSRADFEAMNRVLSAHRLHPVIDQVFSLADAPEAFSTMKNAKHFGKIVIQVVT